jgi:hypothetical protein
MSRILLGATLALAAALSTPKTFGQLPAVAADSRASERSLPALNFDISGAKFSVESLMRALKDSKHEGWVLAAYPDPKTSRPLIGAGFSLDVEASEHVQSDPLNPHPFLEPSSAQLWQAAGLDLEQLQTILEKFDNNLAKWNKKGYRKKIKTHQLKPQVSEEEATKLLRVSAMQSVHNAKAYCRNFDSLTAAQQMALSQLVYQMGVNLESFVQFLAVLNGDPVLQEAALTEGGADIEPDHWKEVQQSLMDSQWARRYSTRAVTVIAMFDPTYEQNPQTAEKQIQAVLRPPKKHRRKKQKVRSAFVNEPGSSGKLSGLNRAGETS